MKKSVKKNNNLLYWILGIIIVLAIVGLVYSFRGDVRDVRLSSSDAASSSASSSRVVSSQDSSLIVVSETCNGLDIDNDGFVDAVDVQLAINGALGLEVPVCTDVNNDGVINAVDVQLVINGALGIEMWGEPKSLPFNSDGWEDGGYIYGNTLYFTYINMDMLRYFNTDPPEVEITGPNRNLEMSCYNEDNEGVPHHSCGTYVTFPWGDSVPRADTFFSINTNGVWSEPTPHPLTLGKSATEFVFSNKNKVYFARNNDDSGMDLYFAEKEDEEDWSEESVVGKINNINTNYNEEDPYVNPEDNEMFFWSDRIDNGPNKFGGKNIYRSVKKVDGEWEAPVIMPEQINSNGEDMMTFLHEGYLYFASDRDMPDKKLRIWKSKRLSGDNKWDKPEMIIESNYGGVGEPTLTEDGKTLYFVQIISDGNGNYNSDLMYVERIS